MNLIYVASPYAGDVEQNVENAKEYCRYVMEQGNVPLASHLLYPQMLDDANPVERGLGTRMGLELLARCDELWAFGAPSPGTETEMAEAERLGIPIRQITMEELEENRMSGKYGIIASRSAASICGTATAWLKNDGEPVEFDTYAEAAEEAHRLNTQSRSPNVSLRFPDMRQLGDITKLKGVDVPPADIVSGGSPCQDCLRPESARGWRARVPACSWNKSGSQKN